MEHALSEVGRTVRYALASTPRTARLITIMMIAIIMWQVMF